MMAIRSALILPLILLLTFSACKKSSDDAPTAHPVNFTFRNNVPSQIHIDIYGSHGDYNTNHAVVASADLAVGAQYVATGLDSGHIYYIDWYSPDYLYNNWYYGTAISQLFTAFTPVPANNSATLSHPNEVDFSRIIFLKGNGTGSSWQAVDALDNTGASVWSSLSQNSRTRQLSFTKGFTGSYGYYTSDTTSFQGKLINYLPDSRNSTVPAFTASFIGADSSSSGIYGSIRSTAPGASGRPAKDTFLSQETTNTGAILRYVFVRY